MEAEEVLCSIMTKLKKYKTNPKKTTVQDKVRQKNLMKLFYIYSSLRRKEQARKKLNEQKKCVENFVQEASENDNEVFEKDVSNYCDKSQVKSEEEDEILEASIVLKSSSSTDNLVADSDIKDEINTPNYKYNLKCHDVKSEIATASPNSTALDLKNQRTNNQSDQESEKSLDISDNEHCYSVDDFLTRLGDRLKKLPYRRRSKLEIEFLTRLYEVEENLGLLDN